MYHVFEKYLSILLQADLPAAPTSQGRDPQTEIMQMLFVHEKKSGSVPVPVGASDDESSTSESDDEPEKPVPPSYTSAASAFGNDYLGSSGGFNTSTPTFGASTGFSSNTGFSGTSSYGATSAFGTTSAFGDNDTFGATSNISVTPADTGISSFSGVVPPAGKCSQSIGISFQDSNVKLSMSILFTIF